MSRILVVDDEPSQRALLEAVLRTDGHACTLAPDGAQALAALERVRPDLVLLDVRMPGLDGLEVLARIRALPEAPPVVMVTAFGDVATAVEAMKRGASDFVEKPVDLDRLRSLVRGLLDAPGAGAGPGGADDDVEPAEYVGTSEAAREIRRFCRLAAGSTATVLVTGESGTGKEVAARAIHRLSARAGGPFVGVNCAAVPADLLESELFGHERGAFTGAVARKVGLFEAASGGTLLLDEVAEMSPSLQTKLLRVLQERTLERLGATRPIPIDVRVIAATNRPVDDALRAGALREDLYYRLAVLHLHLPPLRERPEDVLALARTFLDRHGGGRPRRLAPATVRQLTAHPWPGNARELENTIERALLFAQGADLLPAHLPPPLQAPSPSQHDERETGVRAGWSLQEVERDLIVKTLRSHGGNRTRTAAELGLSRRALQMKMKRFGIA